MKNLILMFFMILCVSHIFAQDIIVMRSGEEIEAKVAKIGGNEIEYKKWSNQDGPLYTVNKDRVFMIKYSNGDKELFDDKESQQKTVTNKSNISNRKTKALPADDNEEQKAQYAELPSLNLKPSNKKTKDFFPIMAFTDSSVISTKEITIFIIPEGVEHYDGGWKVKIGYDITILNKTDEPIYIDRANCFRRFNDFDTKSYFDNKQITVTNGSGSGVGLGVGVGPLGVGLGKSTNSTYSENFGVGRILAIGPRSKANLTDYEYIRLAENKAKFKTVSDIEYWGFNLRSNSPIRQGEVKTYTEEDTPYSNVYSISYSTDPDFNDIYTMNFELYAKYLVGEKLKDSKWSMGQGASKIVEEIQKIVPDFYTNSMTIVGMSGKYD